MTDRDSEPPAATDPSGSRRDRARASLLGVACGDALGRPVAGDAPAAVRDRHGRVTEMLGADGRPAGTTTDPTAAAVAAAERLLDRADAAVSADLDPPSADRPGALLAAVPYGCLAGDAHDRAAAAAEAALVAGTAAGDDVAAESSAALATVVGELVDGESVADAVSTAMSVAVARDAPVPVRETLSVVGDRGAVTIDPAGDPAAVFETALHEAVAAADAEEAIVSAVSRGGHASVLGAVAGAVAGARFGAVEEGDAIPARWLNELGGAADLRALADALVAREVRIDSGVDTDGDA
ncbi:ADP-ribosylglycohydrolase family protein [Halobaculum magnesiiphilum]|uniref:ADP-ribosylglycohydrolase family protein n=1 Tax=Halobaculum magnesiiphilum TaxID=1017351 RepID=A0A8T8WE82_9EURY|nr:ADP-ribosylglycohydrolase family protein [Halobaculum magnesiiphilum]QZP38182.1 ADP-ribosylglycohydrolase family protein [Halobaculum magnesiiphilum]